MLRASHQLITRTRQHGTATSTDSLSGLSQYMEIVRQELGKKWRAESNDVLIRVEDRPTFLWGSEVVSVPSALPASGRVITSLA